MIIHLLASTFMLGVIWFVQIVHYPLFAEVGWMTFTSYEQQHTVLTSWVVIPPMTAELLTAAYLFRSPDHRVASACRWLLPITALIWAITFLIHVPQHETLLTGFDAGVHGQLVLSNWIRTLLWTAKSGLLFSALLRLLRPDAVSSSNPALQSPVTA